MPITKDQWGRDGRYRKPTAREAILETLAKRGPLTTKQIAGRNGIGKRGVMRAATTLSREGVIVAVGKDGSDTIWAMAPTEE